MKIVVWDNTDGTTEQTITIASKNFDRIKMFGDTIVVGNTSETHAYSISTGNSLTTSLPGGNSLSISNLFVGIGQDLNTPERIRLYYRYNFAHYLDVENPLLSNANFGKNIIVNDESIWATTTAEGRLYLIT